MAGWPPDTAHILENAIRSRAKGGVRYPGDDYAAMARKMADEIGQKVFFVGPRGFIDLLEVHIARLEALSDDCKHLQQF